MTKFFILIGSRWSNRKEVQIPGIYESEYSGINVRQTIKFVIFSGDHVYLRLWSGIRIFTATFPFCFFWILREDLVTSMFSVLVNFLGRTDLFSYFSFGEKWSLCSATEKMPVETNYISWEIELGRQHITCTLYNFKFPAILCCKLAQK